MAPDHLADLSGLLSTLAADPGADQWWSQARSGENFHTAITAPPAMFPMLAAIVAHPQFGARPTVVFTPTVRAAEDLASQARAFLPAHQVAVFPAWETLPHERLSPSADIVGQRMAVIHRLTKAEPAGSHGPISLLIMPIRAALQPIVKGLAATEPIVIKPGEEHDPTEVARRLVSAGYTRTELVERRGQFAIRGGIVDVFAPTDDHPLRLEFFGDTVEEIRRFAVSDQRSLGRAKRGLWAPVCRELLLTESVQQRAKAALTLYPALADLLGPMSEAIAVEGMEAVAPLVVDGMESVLSLLPATAIALITDPTQVIARAAELQATSAEFLAAGWDVAAEGGAAAPVQLAESAYWEFGTLQRFITEHGYAQGTLSPFSDGDETSDGVQVDAVAAPKYRGDLESAATDLADRLAAGDRLVIIAAGTGSAERITEKLGELNVPARLVTTVAPMTPAPIVEVSTGDLQEGFVAESAKLVVITEADLFGSSAVNNPVVKMPSRRRKAIDPLSLTPGDFVVHEHHGVGRYIEMVQREVAGINREYLVLEYAPSKRGHPADRLFVPTDQLDLITRYVGGEAPAVHRLGGADWQKSRTKARKAVRQIVDGLVKLYAARQQSQGRAFGPDTPWQRELEDAFPYAETPDQLACIEEVKADMEKPVPMDRVICGDVGFGKTEIAVRAAFKAVADGSQVIVLVPTTLLAKQHLQTFSERFAPFPVKVSGLSRFSSTAESKAVLAGLADGSVDVVVATHRILSPQTSIKNLGLVIVDEEQRFGVDHKEHLKALRTNVDVLTMSATPIPRTLEMAVTGIREMSTIATPPEQRLPVLTFVGPYHDKQVAAAIRRELARDGQVFFVHNRVESIGKVAARISDLVPEAKVAVAHGQMREGELERVMVDFWERNFNVLVATTIVESGLDIPNANTLIVDRADMFGLSQLHQIRGRVGRGRDRAYAYFLYDPHRPLSEAAYERLSTIAQRTELGSGMAVAMKDLEIRGSGNLLGEEQAGHIANVGFDLYVRMVSEALAEVKGEVSEVPNTKLELPLDAHIPERYIPEERLRLAAYRAFAEASDEAAIAEVMAELADRYGRAPTPVQALATAAALRIRLAGLGISEAVVAGERLRLEGLPLPDSLQMRLTRLYPGCTLKPATQTALVPIPKTARVGGTLIRGDDLVTWLNGFIDAVSGLAPRGPRKEDS